jgi:hypothetical protein
MIRWKIDLSGMKQKPMLERSVGELFEEDPIVAQQNGDVVNDRIQQGTVFAHESALEWAVEDISGTIDQPTVANGVVHPPDYVIAGRRQSRVIFRATQNSEELAFKHVRKPRFAVV